MDARTLLAWASIWFARTEGEVGRGTERAKERARFGVLVRAVLSASELWGRDGGLVFLLLFFLGLFGFGVGVLCHALEDVVVVASGRLTLRLIPHAL